MTLGLVPASAVNLVLNVGHGTIRRPGLENEDRDPTPEELERMKQMVDSAMTGDESNDLSFALQRPTNQLDLGNSWYGRVVLEDSSPLR